MEFVVKGILSYPHLFTPRAAEEGGEKRYSANVLVKENDPQLPAIYALFEQAKANGFPNGFPPTGKVSIGPSTNYPGWVEIKTATKEEYTPAVVNMNRQPVLDPGAVVPGATVCLAAKVYPYSLQMSKGVTAGLNAVMLTGEMGELGRLDNRASVDQLFAGVGEGTPAAPAPNFMGGTPAPAPAAPVAPAPAPAAPVAPPAPATPPAPPAAPVTPQYEMTAKAGGVTLEAYLGAGWTHEALVSHGLAVLQ